MSWLEPLKLAIKLYNDGDHKACVVQVESMLTDALPPYPRMRCQILLGHALDSWYEAEVCRFHSLEMTVDSLLCRQHAFEPRTTWHTGASFGLLPALPLAIAWKYSTKRFAIFLMT